MLVRQRPQALAAIAQESASTDSSPLREVITSPVTPMWSPRSTSCFHAASASAPTRSWEIITWMSPLPSRMVAKQSLPPIRLSTTRPVTPTRSPVAASGGRSGYALAHPGEVSVRGYPTGYGSMPAARAGPAWPGAPASARARRCRPGRSRSPAQDYRSAGRPVTAITPGPARRCLAVISRRTGAGSVRPAGIVAPRPDRRRTDDPAPPNTPTRAAAADADGRRQQQAAAAGGGGRRRQAAAGGGVSCCYQTAS